MALELKTDLIAGVLAAGDPARQRLAAQRLGALANEGATAGAVPGLAAPAADTADVATVADARPFAEVLADVVPARPEPPSAVRLGIEEARIALLNRGAPGEGRAAAAPAVAEQFEAAALQTFIGAMMPPAAAAMAGGGTAGGIWASLLTEHIAAAMARAGGIGVAALLEQGRDRSGS